MVHARDPIYPPPPADVPADLNRLNHKFRLQAWAAVSGLCLFLAVYFGMTAWFGWFAWSELSSFARGHGGLGAMAGLAALFLFVVMLKGLFRVRREDLSGLVECSEEEQPELFRFARRVAEEVGAPRPHRVFLSNSVNAGVFQDLALWNLVIPTRKNLEIGLGLVNVLSMDEFKAVIAHEFGHFAQKTMTVGCWVHVTHQVVADLIHRRDIFDRMLDWACRIDLRVSWIGWGLRLVVWSIRSMLDTMFTGVMALERALAREMEFQADLASVRLCGSDSIVHGLLKLEAADGAWERALAFAFHEARANRPPLDIFALQSRILERMGEVLGDPHHGRPPDVPAANPEAHRVFRRGIAHAPRMWASHPPSQEREDNVKKTYIASPRDGRPAWILFRDAGKLRREMTSRSLEGRSEKEKSVPAPPEETLERLDGQFSRPHLNPAFRGTYLWRQTTRHASRVADLYERRFDQDDSRLADALGGLYPPSLAQEMNQLKDLSEQKEALEGLRQGFLSAPGGVIQFRGRTIRRKELPGLIEQVEQERAAIEHRIQDHDRKVRETHRRAARMLGDGWEGCLTGLTTLLHYAEHTHARLQEAEAYLGHVYAVATADNKVTKKEMARLQDAGLDIWRILREIHDQRLTVRLPAAMRLRDEGGGWAECLPDRMELQAPSVEDIGQGWLLAAQAAVQVYLARLWTLRQRSLDMLVEAEAQVGRSLLEGADPGPAPGPAQVPSTYKTLLAGQERPLTERPGWWERFQVADGPLPATARFAVAACLLGPAVFLAMTVGTLPVAIHNGLGIPVVVDLDGMTRTIQPHDTGEISRRPGRVTVSARRPDGMLIERFDAVLEPSGATIYNVAGASVLVEVTATYGPRPPVPTIPLDSTRWVQSHADAVFQPPPDTLQTPKESGGEYQVVQHLDEDRPWDQIGGLTAERRGSIALAHGRWDPIDHPDLAAWLEVAAGASGFHEVLRIRVEEAPANVALRRAEMDTVSSDQRAELCRGWEKAASESPDDPDRLYLSVRCRPDSPEQDEAFIQGARRFPQNAWLSWAAHVALSNRADFAGARDQLATFVQHAWVRRSTLGPLVASEYVRLQRLLAKDPARADVSLTQGWVSWIDEGLKTERWTAPPEAATPYSVATWHLLAGRLQEAIATPRLTDPERSLVNLRVALSEGANPDQVRTGLGQAIAHLDEWSLMWPVVALASREGLDTTNMKGRISSHPAFSSAVWEVLTSQDLLRRDPARLDRALEGIQIDLRGFARMAGIVALGADAPDEWRQEAAALVLPGERVYFRPAAPGR
ncbi:MAG: M48 family metalloprotease [Candidatus Polarisedimenticolia bacterium]